MLRHSLYCRRKASTYGKLSQRNSLPVITQFHPRRQHGVRPRVPQVVRDVREDRPLWLELPSHFDRLIERKVGHVRPDSQRVDNEHVEPSQSGHALGRNAVGIGAIGHVSKAKTEYVKSRAVLEPHRLHLAAQQVERSEIDPLERKLRRGTRVSIESSEAESSEASPPFGRLGRASQGDTGLDRGGREMGSPLN